MRFRLRRGDFEVELEGEFEYVREQFEVLQGNLRPTTQTSGPVQNLAPTDIPAEMKDSVTGVVEYTTEGKPHLIVPVDNLSAKEAISIVMYSIHPKPLGGGDLSSLLSSSWKATNESDMSLTGNDDSSRTAVLVKMTMKNIEYREPHAVTKTRLQVLVEKSYQWMLRHVGFSKHEGSVFNKIHQPH